MNNHPLFALVASLKQVLADTYALSLKTQNYHWNVTGPHFESLHLLFEAQYKDLTDAIDLIAERIRALGERIPASLSLFDKMKTLSDGDENANAQTMVRDLADDQLAIVKTLKAALACAQNRSDEVTINLLVDRLTVHEKNHWMLMASL